MIEELVNEENVKHGGGSGQYLRAIQEEEANKLGYSIRKKTRPKVVLTKQDKQKLGMVFDQIFGKSFKSFNTKLLKIREKGRFATQLLDDLENEIIDINKTVIKDIKEGNGEFDEEKE